jgi:hypothetical protein
VHEWAGDNLRFFYKVRRIKTGRERLDEFHISISVPRWVTSRKLKTNVSTP